MGKDLVMPYTDAHGRPEIVADESLKLDGAGWRVAAAGSGDDADGVAGRAAAIADAGAGGAAEPRSAEPAA
jgi:hypothetical protein